jgi:hypothetical protein
VTRTAAQIACLNASRGGADVPPRMTVATINSLVEMEQYRIGLKLDGRLTGEAMHEIAVRQKHLQATMHSTGNE